jgi:hypothetical protein
LQNPSTYKVINKASDDNIMIDNNVLKLVLIIVLILIKFEPEGHKMVVGLIIVVIALGVWNIFLSVWVSVNTESIKELENLEYAVKQLIKEQDINYNRGCVDVTVPNARTKAVVYLILDHLGLELEHQDIVKLTKIKQKDK